MQEVLSEEEIIVNHNLIRFCNLFRSEWSVRYAENTYETRPKHVLIWLKWGKERNHATSIVMDIAEYTENVVDNKELLKNLLSVKMKVKSMKTLLEIWTLVVKLR